LIECLFNKNALRGWIDGYENLERTVRKYRNANKRKLEQVE
jgi:hypothetical protein